MPWVDYLRGIAIILVVYRHSLIGIERSGMAIPSYLIQANMIFYSFRMPLFFIVSGMFISSSLKKKGLQQIIVNKFDNLFYPYLIWCFIQITIQIILNQYTNSDRSLTDYTYILYQPRNLDQFWYLPALFNTTLIYLLVKVYFKPSSYAQIILGLLLYYSSAYMRNISMISDWMEFYLFFAAGDCLHSFFFSSKTQNNLKKRIALILSIPVFAITQFLYLKNSEEFYKSTIGGQTAFIIIAFVGCSCMFILAYWLQERKILSPLRIFGYHSLYIYVIHVLVIGLVRVILGHFIGIRSPELILLASIAFGITIPVVLYNSLSTNKFGSFLFSFRGQKN